MSTTSSTTTPFGGYRVATRTIVLAVAVALVAAFVVTVVATRGVSGFGLSREAEQPASTSMPTPEWLKHYLGYQAPVAATSVPAPEWLEHYLGYEAPSATSVPAPEWLEHYLAYEAPSASSIPAPEWLESYVQ